MFKFTETPIKGLFVIELNKLDDSRGYFMERYKRSIFHDMGITEDFTQDNMSWSCNNTIRGLHYQNEPNAQGKLVSCLWGEILDIAVDLRPDSPTYKQHIKVILNISKMIYIPPNFAHGFSVPITQKALVCQKCTNEYSKEDEGGIRYDDPTLSIDWNIPKGKELISKKDKQLPNL